MSGCRIIQRLIFATAMITVPTVHAQNYPQKPVRIIASEVGGIIDFAVRVIAQELTGILGQPVIVDNRGSAIMGDIAAKAVADGHTLLASGGALWAEPLMKRETYDPLQHFAPITIATRSPNVVVVHPSLAVNSTKELIAMARAKPGVLNYGSSTAGTSSHLAAELFKNMAGVDIVRIGYKGTGAALNALIGGEVQVMFSNVGAEPHRRAGKIKGLAVTSAEPSALFPGLPTVAATVPGYESVSIIALFAPVKTPPNIVARLNQEVVRILQRSDIKEKFFNTGAETVGSSQAQLANAVKSESARLGKLIKDASIRAE